MFIITRLRIMKQLPRISFGALSIFHARRGRIDASARTVNHALENYFVETWIALPIGQFGTDDAVDLICFDLVSEPYENVSVR
jgi:hypothetical protein